MEPGGEQAMWKGEWKFYVFIWPGGLVWLLGLLAVIVALLMTRY